MEWRELEYYLLLYKLFDQPPIQVVLYFWFTSKAVFASRNFDQPPIQVVLYFGSAPLAMRGWIANESLQFRYLLLDIRRLKSEYFLEGGSLSDAILAVLSTPATITPEEVVEKVVERFRALPAKEQRDWLEKLMIISGLRGYEDLVRK